MIQCSPNEALYEWAAPYGYGKVGPQYEIVRLIMAPKGLHRAAITKKGPFSPAERDLWIKRLTLSGIKPLDKQAR